MSTFSYGGSTNQSAGVIPTDGITLEQATILDWDRKPSHHGPNYTYSRWTFRVRGIYNPLATSYQQASALAAPTQRTGLRAAQTDAAVRHLLSQPRRQLIVKVGTTTVLQSPAPSQTVDASGGPFVRVNEVSLVSGTKTFLVDLSIQTDVNECYNFTASPPVMLSHLWTMRHSIDQDYYCTRTIEGEAVFNVARLTALGRRADDYRAHLFHPVFRGGQRVRVEALVDQVGGRLSYTLVDRERTHTIGEAAARLGVTRIECTHSSEVSKPQLHRQVATAAIGVGAGAVGGAKVGAKIGSFFGPFGTALGGLVGTIGGGIIGGVVASDAKGNIPVNTQAVDVRVWGNQASAKVGLRTVALAVLAWRLEHAPTTAGATQASFTDDVAGRFVHAHAVITAPPIAISFSGGLNISLPVNVRAFLPQVPGQFDNGGVRVLSDPEFNTNTLGPPTLNTFVGPPGAGRNGSVLDSGNARGTYVEALTSAALLAPCATPAAATATPRATTRTP